MNPFQAFLTRTQKEVNQLQTAVKKRLTTAPSRTKRTAAVESVAVVIDLRTALSVAGVIGSSFFSPRESPYVNGAEDFYITEVCWDGFVEGVPSLLGGALGAYRLDASDQGVFPAFQNVAGFGGDQFPFFDFEWNFRVQRDGSLYNPGTNGSSHVSRRSMGVRNRGVLLEFTDPFKVPAGDTLTWMLKPTFLDRTVLLGPGASGDLEGFALRMLTINFTMNGYRTGMLAEADYERI